MDLFNSIAKAVVDTTSNIAKAVIYAKPADAKAMIQPLNNNLLVKNQDNVVKARIVNISKKEESNEQSTGLF